MLVLTRRTGEQIVLGENVRLTVVAIGNNQVRLGFTAPVDVTIRREEQEPSLARLGGRPSGADPQPRPTEAGPVRGA